MLKELALDHDVRAICICGFYRKSLQVILLASCLVGGLRFQFMDFILCCCNGGYKVVKHSYFVYGVN